MLVGFYYGNFGSVEMDDEGSDNLDKGCVDGLRSHTMAFRELV